ncbi:MAG: protein kinase [Steroidobacteraceae bacterium]
MEQALAISIGQCSSPGPKDINQDFYGALIPNGVTISLKGVALAVADGISTSSVAHIAAETAVKNFLSDYYSTSDAWSVRTAGLSVIAAANAWLHAETRRSHNAYDRDRGYICTFSALVIKGRFAHIFHVGDSRIFRVVGNSLEPLTNDHRGAISAKEHYLSRALGLTDSVNIDYQTESLTSGDIFLLSTDGVHEFISPKEMARLIHANANDLDRAAKLIIEHALQNGSDDNLTVQIARIDELPDDDASEYTDQAEALPPAPLLEPPVEFEGYALARTIHSNDRSHIYLATDIDSDESVALKIPAVSLRHEPHLLRQFMMEEWIARRLSSPHVLKAHNNSRTRKHLFIVTEYIEGQSLRQWLHDHPHPELQVVRDIIEQIIKGLRALHRKEMIHGDIRPENIMMARDGTVKIIDFGSVRVAGLVELTGESESNTVLGTVQYTAPEWLAGETPTWQADMYSAAVIAYELLTGKLPYGATAARVRTPADQRKLNYISARTANRHVPDWIDGALRTALHPNPYKRYAAMSEFIHDLRVPNPRFQLARQAPLLERDPVLFWKGVSLLLALSVVALLISRR